MRAPGQLFSGLLWDIDAAGVTLTATSAQVASGSQLVNVNAGGTVTPVAGTDLASYWAFRNDLTSEIDVQYAVGAMGDLLFNTDLLGTDSMIDGDGLPPSPGQLDYTIIGNNIASDVNSGIINNGPLVQNAVEIHFAYTGSFGELDIKNVQPLFGTDGAPLVPEPTTLILLGSGLLGLAAIRKKR